MRKTKLSDILVEEKNWMKFRLATDADDNYVCPTSLDAVKFCLIGAVHRVAGTTRNEFYWKGFNKKALHWIESLNYSIAKLHPEILNDKRGIPTNWKDLLISNFNDNKNTTWPMVQVVVAEADKQNKWHRRWFRKLKNIRFK